MSILLMDGFEQYTNGGDFPTNKKFGANNWNPATGRFGYGQCVNAGTFTQMPLGTTVSQLVLGCALRFDNSLGNSARIIATLFGNGGTARQYSFATKPDGSLHIVRNNDTGQLKVSSAGGVIKQYTWHYVEFVVDYSSASDTGSSGSIYVDGVQVATATGVNLRDNGNYVPDSISWDFNSNTYMDDLYMLAGELTPFGDSRISTLVPNADTAQKDWTASTGSNNYATIDELPVSASDYNSASTAGAKDRYDLTTLGFTPTAIHAVKAFMGAYKDDATTRTARVNLVSGAATSNGTTLSVPSTLAQLEGPGVVLDPNTSAAWTKSAIDALQLELEVVS